MLNLLKEQHSAQHNFAVQLIMIFEVLNTNKLNFN